jgi:hypothetical protein
MGEPWVWDGTQWVSQDGYWTTADMQQGSMQEVTQPVAVPQAAPREIEVVGSERE